MLCLARSILTVNLSLCGTRLVLLMRNALACLNESGAATFSQFVTKICDVDQNEGLTTRVGDVYLCRTSNMDNMLMVLDIRMM